MMRYNDIKEWIEKNFSSDELEELECSQFEMDADAYNLAYKYLVPAKYNWKGERICFKNYVFIFTFSNLIGYYNNNNFTETKCIHDWNLCELYNIAYVNPYEIKEEKWGVLKIKNKDLYVGIETPIGNNLVHTIYKANIIGALEWKRFKEEGYEFFSESLDNGSYIDNNDLEFIEIKIQLIS